MCITGIWVYMYLFKQNHIKMPVLLVKTGWILTVSRLNLLHLLNGMTGCLRNEMNSLRYMIK